MNSDKIVCYLFTVFDKKETLINFVKHYKKHKSGINHQLIICFKLFETSQIKDLKKHLINIDYKEFIDKGKNNDWDFGSYKRVSEFFYNKDILFLSSHSYPVCNDWLKKLFIFKNEKTVIAPTASYESLVDSIKLKNKFYKIIRYLIRKYKFTKNFNKFPNPHLRTSSFLINSKVFLDFIKNKKIRNKEDTLKIESGKNSLTNYLKNKKIKILVVNLDGEKFEENNWKYSETYNFLNHDKSIISDKHSRKYLKLNNEEKTAARLKVWGI